MKTKAELEATAYKDLKTHADTFGLPRVTNEKKPELIDRILAAQGTDATDPPPPSDDDLEPEDLDGTLDEMPSLGEDDDVIAFAKREDEAIAKILAPQLQIPPALKDALTPHVRKGLKFRINPDNTFSMKFGNREDSGTLNQPVEVIARCAKRLLA